ncbi:MAG TPA: hypothetical protein VNY05_04140 [Candidatus Acidoferrales bacterium]|nr:hypothetical protein [Candidatus Acidoferrales bacterium]
MRLQHFLGLAAVLCAITAIAFGQGTPSVAGPGVNMAEKTWRSTLVPGYPQDTSAEGVAPPLHGLQAPADVIRPGTNGLFF